MPVNSVATRAALAALLVFASCTDAPDVGEGETATPRGRRAAQAPAAAQRDDVPPGVAEQPFRRRVNPSVTVSSDDEMWVISTPDGADPDDYAEILLFDKRRPRRILRAYPFEGVAPERLALAEGGLYCGRGGDTELPDTMVCRIDREAFELDVRIYPRSGEPQADYPSDWTIADTYLEMHHLEADEDAAWSKASDGTWTRLDPTTLQIVERGVARSE